MSHNHHGSTPLRTLAAVLILISTAPLASLATERPCASVQEWGRSVSLRTCTFDEPMSRSAVGVSTPGATSLPWTVPSAAGDDYCVRIQGQATGYSDPPLVTGGTFTVGGGGP